MASSEAYWVLARSPPLSSEAEKRRTDGRDSHAFEKRATELTIDFTIILEAIELYTAVRLSSPTPLFHHFLSFLPSAISFSLQPRSLFRCPPEALNVLPDPLRSATSISLTTPLSSNGSWDVRYEETANHRSVARIRTLSAAVWRLQVRAKRLFDRYRCREMGGCDTV